MPQADWEPIEKVWGELAHREVLVAYPSRIKSKGVALCVWCLAQDRAIPLDDIEAIASEDPDIEPRKPGGKKISTQCLVQARKVLGLVEEKKKKAAPKKPKQESSLTRTEKTILTKLHEGVRLYERYVKAARNLAEVQAVFEHAREGLRSIKCYLAEAIADAEPAAAQVFRKEGILGEDPEQHVWQEEPPEAVLTDATEGAGAKLAEAAQSEGDPGGDDDKGTLNVDDIFAVWPD